MSHNSDRQSLTQSVFEGVVFAIRDNMAALEASGTKLNRLTAVGGGSKSHFWLKILATALNLPIDIPAKGDFGGAFGAARLAMLASSDEAPSTILSSPMIEHIVEPVSDLRDQYSEAYATYKKIYPAIKSALN